MIRKSFTRKDQSFSYLDQGGNGEPIVALHAYWMEAGTFADLAAALAPEWRVIALDQRGHVQSAKPDDLSWDAFIADLDAFLHHLGITRSAILVGNSIGGTVAFRYAARNPGRVRAMVIEESPAVEDANLDFMRAWEGVFPTREALVAAIGERLAWSVEPSFVQRPDGWTLGFSPTQLADALPGLNGDFWDDWASSSCRVLLVRGRQRRAVDPAILEAIAKRRPDTELITLDAGHVAHHDLSEEFAFAVARFLEAKAEL